MKKIAIIITTLTLSLIALFCICSNKNLDSYFETLDKIEEIKEKRSFSDKIRINNLYFNDSKLMLDDKTNIYYCMLDIENIDNYNPLIEYSSSSNVKLAIENIEIDEESIKNNQKYELLVYNNQNYNEYKIVFTTLPLMNIDVEDEIGNDYISAKYTVLNNGKEVGESNNTIYDIEGKIRLKGASTKTFPKKSFRIKLNRTNNLLNVRKGTDYVLYAAYNDQERIRNVFSSKLWYESCAQDNDLGINAGMYYEYVELFINNEYWGLYALGYPIDEQQLKINANSNMENIYKKILWDSELSITEYSNEPVDGYELKTEFNDESWLFLRALYINTYKDYNENFLLSALDNNNAVDILLFYLLIQGEDDSDGYKLKNTYIITKLKYNQLTYLYIPWDMDLTFTNSFFDYEDIYISNYKEKIKMNFIMKSNPIYTVALKNEEIKNRIISKYRGLRKTEWSDSNINKIIDDYEKDIYFSGSYARDIERWPYSKKSIEKNLSKFRKYVADRLTYLDKNIEKSFDM